MKKLILLLVCLCGLFGFSQKYMTRTGQVSFEASVSSFEEIKATNSSVTAIINTDNGEFAALVLVKGFRFKNALMEEHFNENYAESDTYPKATFKGQIKGFNLGDVSNETTTYTYSGSLEFHGQIKPLDGLTLNLSRDENNRLVLTGNFEVNVDDFNITIPKIVNNKVSKNVNVSYNFTMTKK